MKDSAGYVKIVEWSDEDQCYVGRPLPPRTSGRDLANKLQHVV